LRLQSDKFELVSTDGATTIFIQDVEKSWFRSLMQKFSMRGKKTAAGVYFCAIHVFNGLFLGNPAPFCERRSGFCTKFVVYHSVGEYVYNFQRRRLVAR